MYWIKKIFLFPFKLISLFVDKLFNYKQKKAKKHGEECYEEEDNSLSFIERRINKIKNQQLKNQNYTKAITHKSVWFKFTFLLCLTFLTGLIAYIYFIDKKNCEVFFNKFYQFTIYFKIDRYFYELWDNPKPEDLIYWLRALPNLISLVILAIITPIWWITFYWILPLLKPMTYLLSISFGFMMGCLFSFCRIIHTLWLGKFFAFFLFVIPLVATVFVLVFVTYLYQFKKVKFTLEQKGKIINYFFVLFLLQYIILNIVSFMADNYLLITILYLILYTCEFVFASLVWIVALDELDIYVKIKFPKKYEYFIINLMFISVIESFMAVFNFVFKFFEYVKISQKK